MFSIRASTSRLADGKVEADLVIFQTIQDFVGWKQQGVLLNFKPEGFDQVCPEFPRSDGAYVAIDAIPIVYAYNTKRCAPDEASENALDFLKPQFAGKLISVYPGGRRRHAVPLHTPS